MNRQQAHFTLNQYLAAELGRSLVLPDISMLSRQREAFLARFGPDHVATMTGQELLRQLPIQLPHNGSNEHPMDFWLEFKNDEVFDQSLFGSVAAGSLDKYGTWCDEGKWKSLGGSQGRGRRPHVEISENAALGVLENRRTEMLAVVEAVRPFSDTPVDRINPAAFQASVESAAPLWHASTWLHKYLHINFPGLITLTGTDASSKAELYRVGMVADAKGIYARGIRIVQFWASLPALNDLPVHLRYRASKGLVPREHWCLGLAGNVSAWKHMVAHGYFGVGPQGVGDLSRAAGSTKRRDVKEVVKAAFRDANLADMVDGDDSRTLVELVLNVKEQSVVALFSDASTVEAVGEVIGGYQFVPGSERPHQVPVRWYHNRSFEITGSPVEVGTRLLQFEPTDSAVADIEASLVAIGIGPWPGFSSVAIEAPLVLPQKSSVSAAGVPGASIDSPPLPPLQGITRQVVDMLERKRQVILYGPPGTGKTHHALDIALEVVARQNFNCLPSQLSGQQRDAVHGRNGTGPYLATCTFHPMYSYEDFIEGYRPDGDGFKLESGIFKRMVIAAQAQPKMRFVLIIDEINRGNIPKIFGELITLIEASKRGKTSSILPLSNKSFTVPDNLFVIGTMNTADRSILLLDTALRRRFAFKELLPEPHLLRKGTIGDITLDTWLRALNKRITEQLGRNGRNLQVGHAYLMHSGKPVTTLTRIGEIVRDEIWPLLQEYCYEDSKKLAKILAADKGGIFDSEAANLRFGLFEPGKEEDLAHALMAIVTPDDKKHVATHAEDIPDDEDTEEPLDDMESV